MKKLLFYEYGGFQNSDKQEATALAEFPLSKGELEHLRFVSESAMPGKDLFDISTTTIKANSIVGIISFGAVHIEVLPKLLRYEHTEKSIVKNLMFMLSYTNALDIYDSGLGDMGKDYDSFIEAYISIFANRLSKYLVRFGPPHSYVERSENLNFIKGKIAFTKHSSVNCIDNSKIFCDYSEFTMENPISKSFKFVAQSLQRLTKNTNSQIVLNRCLGLLDGVKAEFVPDNILDRCVYGKRDPSFIGLINLTKMFLRKMRPEFSGQKSNQVFTLLFDMNELFEEFVFQVLKRNEDVLGVRVERQKHKKLVEAERDFLKGNDWNKRALFATYTDIFVKPNDGSRGFVIDTKYKIIDSSKHHYGISNQDAYQVLAYRQIHKEEQIEPCVALLYPMSGEEIRKEFKVTGSNSSFLAWTTDISIDLKSNIGRLVVNLGVMISKAKLTGNDVAKF